MVKQFKHKNLKINYEVIHRDIKYPRLEYRTGKLNLILPNNYKEPETIIEKHKNWIYEKTQHINNNLKKAEGKNLNLKRTEEELKKLIYNKADQISRDFNLKPNKIYFRKMKSKWASCSPNKNLTFNKLLKYLPNKIIEYVIFHEIIHLIEKKHNKNFWKIITERFPDYKNKEQELFIYWFLIQTRLNQKNSN